MLSLTNDQALKLEILRLLVSAGVNADELVDKATQIQKWFLESGHQQPYGTDGKA